MPLQSYADTLLRRLRLRVVRAENNGLAIEATDADLATYARVRPLTMTTPERLWALMQSVRYVVANQIDGDFVECGVWRGGSAMAMALTLTDLGAERRLWLYDTYAGMTEPSAVDVEVTSGKSASALLSDAQREPGSNAWCIASLDDVRANMASTGYPSDGVVFRVGDVAETLRDDLPGRIALLRLDTDFYESTKVELEVLYPRLQRGGVCIIDDYGHWQGTRQAVDEYLAAHALAPLLHRVDRAGRVFVKP